MFTEPWEKLTQVHNTKVEPAAANAHLIKMLSLVSSFHFLLYLL